MMLSPEQRRERLEALLERVQRNRSRMGERPAASASAGVPPAPPSEEAVAPSALDAAATEPEISPPDELFDEIQAEATGSLELDLESPVDDIDGVVIDLSGAEEFADAEAPPAPPSATAEPSLETPATIAEPSPIKKPPPSAMVEDEIKTPMPEPEAVAPAEEQPIDDEPEIEVAYGTEEALALQAELGLSDDEEFPDMDTMVTPDDRLALAGGAEALETDDLPVPAPPEVELDELLEPPTEAKLTAAEPPPRTKIRAKTVEDLSGPLIELALDEKAKEAAPVPADDMPTPRPEPAPPTEAKAKEAPAKPATIQREAPAAQAPVAPAKPSKEAYQAEKVADTAAAVADFVGEAPMPRATTLGELLTRALAVGKK